MVYLFSLRRFENKPVSFINFFSLRNHQVGNLSNLHGVGGLYQAENEQREQSIYF